MPRHTMDYVGKQVTIRCERCHDKMSTRMTDLAGGTINTVCRSCEYELRHKRNGSYVP